MKYLYNVLLLMVLSVFSVFAGNDLNLDLSGHLSSGYLITGRQLDHRNGHFGINDAQIDFSIKVKDDVSVKVEMLIVPFGKESVNFDLGEAYVSLHDILFNKVDIKVGKMTVPFGVLSSQEDSIDNPLVTRSVSSISGIDEGVSLSLPFGDFELTVAGMDGSSDEAKDDQSGKSMISNLTYDPNETFGMHLGVLYNDTTSSTAVTLGNASLTPVSGAVLDNAVIYEIGGHLNLKYISLLCILGKVDLSGITSMSDRSLDYFTIQEIIPLSNKTKFVIRYSQVEVDDQKGYRLGSGSLIGSQTYSLGNNIERLSRVSVGLNHVYSDNVVFKLELGKDDVDVVFPTVTPDNDRGYGAVQVAVSF